MSASPAPRENPDLLGQEEAESALHHAWRSGRLHHAWLLTGPRGIGKATLAFRFARFLLAHGETKGPRQSGGQGTDDTDHRPGAPSLLPSPSPPGASVTTARPDHGTSAGLRKGSLFVDPHDPVFARVASSGHADLITVERQVNEKTGRLRTEIVVDDVRAIAARLAHTPAEGGWRVGVIDGAEDMNRSAANAVLKVLEEPPARAVLLLVSHASGRLLPTIRSRCRKLTMRPLALETVDALLVRWRPELSAAERETLARLSQGSVGTALSLADEGGLALHRAVRELMARMPDLDIVALNRLGDQVARAGADEAFSVTVDFFRWWLACVIRAAAVAGDVDGRIAGSGGAGQDAQEAALAARLAAAAGLDRWLEVWEKTSGLLARAESANLDRKQVILSLFLTVAGAVRH